MATLLMTMLLFLFFVSTPSSGHQQGSFTLHWSHSHTEKFLDYLNVNASFVGPEQLYCPPSSLNSTVYKQNTVYIGVLGSNDPFILSLSQFEQELLALSCNTSCQGQTPGYLPPIPGESLAINII